jgi:hypothetical protein
MQKKNKKMNAGNLSIWYVKYELKSTLNGIIEIDQQYKFICLDLT